jgi:hypothetical protein
VRAGYYKDQLREPQARQAQIRALRSSEQRSTDIFSARDVESIKQRALASIRSQEPPERRFFQMQ